MNHGIKGVHCIQQSLVILQVLLLMLQWDSFMNAHGRDWKHYAVKSPTFHFKCYSVVPMLWVTLTIQTTLCISMCLVYSMLVVEPWKFFVNRNSCLICFSGCKRIFNFAVGFVTWLYSVVWMCLECLTAWITYQILLLVWKQQAMQVSVGSLLYITNLNI